MLIFVSKSILLVLFDLKFIFSLLSVFSISWTFSVEGTFFILLMSDKFSPSKSKIAIGSFTFTASWPSRTKILPMVPSSIDSTSIVALSVSISAIKSPEVTVSPSFTNHLDKVPSSIVGLSAGIKILTVISLYP